MGFAIGRRATWFSMIMAVGAVFLLAGASVGLLAIGFWLPPAYPAFLLVVGIVAADIVSLVRGRVRA
jgi:hypothetical protein